MTTLYEEVKRHVWFHDKYCARVCGYFVRNGATRYCNLFLSGIFYEEVKDKRRDLRCRQCLEIFGMEDGKK